MSDIDYLLTISLAGALFWAAWKEFQLTNQRDGWALVSAGSLVGLAIGAATVLL